MLEAVVEDDRSHAELLYGQPRSVVTVRADQHRDARQPPREEKRLVARFLGIEVDRRGVGDDLDPARAAPVAAADDSWPVAGIGEQPPEVAAELCGITDHERRADRLEHAGGLAEVPDVRSD